MSREPLLTVHYLRSYWRAHGPFDGTLIALRDLHENSRFRRMRDGIDRQRATEFAPEVRELLCERCGREHPVWFTPNAVWNPIIRREDGSDEFAFLCPLCFMELAEERGMVPTAWILAPEGSLETTTTWRVMP